MSLFKEKEFYFKNICLDICTYKNEVLATLVLASSLPSTQSFVTIPLTGLLHMINMNCLGIETIGTIRQRER